MTETRRALLDALGDGPISGPAFADELGVSRAAVWKQVEALRAEGFDVESTDEGYVVRAVPEFGEAAILYGLDADFDVEFHEAIPSTNTRARELAGETRARRGSRRGAASSIGRAADQNRVAETAVVADEQTAGRGRLDREWSGPAGGVYCSLLIRPDRPPAHAPIYTLAAAVAVTRAAREAGVEAVIKWPNDVLVNSADSEVPLGTDDVGDETETRGGRKLCGILTEMEGEADRIGWLIVGIGVNANVDATALPAGATSLQTERGDPVERSVFVQRLLEEFDDLRGHPDAVLGDWREHAVTLGRRVRVETPGGGVVGEAVDVEFPGALIVETDAGERRRVTAGDCEHLRPI